MFGHLQTGPDERLYVQFSSGDDESQEPPDSQLLALHAVYARVAHMSGAAKAFDELEDDVEGTRVLDSDGSSVHLLDYLLKPVVSVS